MTELENLQSLWSQIDQKLDRNWQLNVKNLQSANLNQVKSKMRNLIWVKSITMAFYGIFSLLFMSYAVFRWSVPYQSLVGFCFALWTAAVFATSIHELSLVLAIDYGDSIPVLQKKLIDLKLTIVKYLRLSVWVFPLYFGFIMLIFDLFFGIDIVAKGDPTWLLANGIFSIVVFIPMAIWMHTKLTTKNVNKPWMQKILGGNGRQVNDALSLLKEIEAYDKDKP